MAPQRSLLLLPVLGLVALLGIGCGPNCQSTCSRLYGNAAGECKIERPGFQTAEQLMEVCQDACEEALSKSGEVGSYDPNDRKGSTTAVELENEKQAALWMDCISETSCEYLETGYCAPVW
jgi:hypothetical protein